MGASNTAKRSRVQAVHDGCLERVCSTGGSHRFTAKWTIERFEHM